MTKKKKASANADWRGYLYEPGQPLSRMQTGLRRTFFADSGISAGKLKAQGPSGTCNERKGDDEEEDTGLDPFESTDDSATSASKAVEVTTLDPHPDHRALVAHLRIQPEITGSASTLGNKFFECKN